MDVTITITNSQARILGTCTGRKLLPGKNKFTDMGEKEFATMLQDEGFRSWQKLNWVTVAQPVFDGAPLVPKKPEANPLEMLDGVTVENAKPLIAACEDESLLEAWYERDERKGIKTLIEERVTILLQPAVTKADEPEVDPDLPDGVDQVFGDVAEESAPAQE